LKKNKSKKNVISTKFVYCRYQLTISIISATKNFNLLLYCSPFWTEWTQISCWIADVK